MSDTRDPKTNEHGTERGPDAETVAALDAEIRSLRDEPVAAETLLRMRAGLDARIASAAAAPTRRPTPISARMRGRFGAGLLAAAAAAAAAFFLLLVPALESRHANPPQPQRVVERDAAPAPEQGLEDAPLPAQPSGVDDASDEALAIAFELELLRDYDVIAQLDLLELLDDPAPPTGAGRTDGEGRI